VAQYYACERCGKLRNLAHGTFTSWGGLYPEGKFFCNRCLNIMEKEEADKKLRPFLEIAETAKQLPKFEDMLKEEVINAIKNTCSKPDWYQLKSLTQKLEHQCDVRKVSNILNELGFTQRARKRHGSYTYVFINIALLKV
jgi:hypothetical protein